MWAQNCLTGWRRSPAILATEPVYALRRVPGTGLADGHWGHRRRLWASGESSPGAVRHALDESGGAGRARPAGRAPQRSLGSLLAVSSATATSTPLCHLCAGAGAGGRPGIGVGGVINPPSTVFGHTQMISHNCEIMLMG